MADLTGREEGARVIVPPLAGWRPAYTTGTEPVYRYRLGLNPSAHLIVAFRSALYLVGRQERAVENSATVFSFNDETEWQHATRWPR